MSEAPSQEDINRANPDVGIQNLVAELAAEGKTIADISDEELGKRARQVGLDADQMQSQLRFKRTPGKGIGVGVERVEQRTAAQIIRGNKEPPPAFFTGIPEAMQAALAGINQQRTSSPTRSPLRSIEKTSPEFISEQGPAPGAAAPVGKVEVGILPPVESDAFNQSDFQAAIREQLGEPKTTTSGPTPAQKATEDRMRSEDEITEEDLLNTVNVISSLSSSKNLSSQQRITLDKLSKELTLRDKMGQPITEELFLRLREGPRFKDAFNVLENIEEDNQDILKAILAGTDAISAMPMIAPAAGTARAAGRAVSAGVRRLLGVKPRKLPVRGEPTGSFKAIGLRTGQGGNLPQGQLSTTMVNGRTVGTVQVVKTTNPALASKAPVGAGFNRVGSQFAKSTQPNVRGTAARRNLPPSTSLGGKRGAIVFAIPYENASQEELNAAAAVQTYTLNFVVSNEDFRSEPYEDGKNADGTTRYSIGYGTKSEKNAESIDKDQAMARAQVYLEENVYPEIDFIQENAKVPLEPHQITALSSLIFNVGGSQWGESRARKALLTGDFETFKKEAFTGPTAFLSRNPNLVEGLKNRRQEEVYLFEAMDYTEAEGYAGPTVPRSSTQGMFNERTPPQMITPKLSAGEETKRTIPSPITFGKGYVKS
tara:strand:+ start:154 stop:2115 length:1962 start_codon:yes stop_codon:yes gene_type:complete